MATQTRLSMDALDLDYMRVLRGYVNTIALWPHETFGPRTMRTRFLTIYHRVVLFTYSCIVVSEILMAKHNSKTHDLFYMGQDYVNILILFVMIARMTLKYQMKYSLLVKNFVLRFHLVKHDQESEFAAREHQRINDICRIATIVILLESFFTVVLFNVVPFYLNYRAGMFSDHRPQNGTFVHSVNYYFILDQYTNTIGYTIVFLLNLYICIVCGVLICGLDLLIYIIVFHILGHFNILLNKMRRFPRSIQRPDQSEKLSARLYNEEAFGYLKDLIRHDQLIKEFMNDTLNTFGVTLCICLFFHQVSGCIMLLNVSPMTAEALTRYGLLLLVLWNQLIQTSVIFELIGSKSDILSTEVYALPWELMDIRNRKTILMFLRNVQRPRALKAGGLFSVGVLTMSLIMKNSISYFIILKTLEKD